MVFAHKVARFTISGTMFGGAEEWSTGFYMGMTNADAAELTQQAVDDVLAAWTTFFTSGQSYISNRYQTTMVKGAILGVDGKTETATVKYAYPGSTVSGGATSNHLPPQCALVVTLQSVRARGLASKGRMYLPGVALGIDATGKVESMYIGAIADQLDTFFTAISDDADMPGVLLLAAKGTGPLPALTAQNDQVIRFKVGDVIDTQRRRRNGLQETYTTRELVA